MRDKRISFNYVLAILGSVAFTWLIHEFAHWAASELLGYEAAMSLNKSFPVGEYKPSGWHATWISAAGPLVTVLQGLSAYWFLRSKGWNQYLYPLLFIPFYMRLLAGFMNIINPNDEGRISNFLGLGTYTIPFLVSALLFFLVFRISREYNLSWKFQLGTVVMVMVFSSILIMADQLLSFRIL